jgi:hypothetical protein
MGRDLDERFGFCSAGHTIKLESDSRLATDFYSQNLGVPRNPPQGKNRVPSTRPILLFLSLFVLEVEQFCIFLSSSFFFFLFNQWKNKLINKQNKQTKQKRKKRKKEKKKKKIYLKL